MISFGNDEEIRQRRQETFIMRDQQALYKDFWEKCVLKQCEVEHGGWSNFCATYRFDQIDQLVALWTRGVTTSLEELSKVTNEGLLVTRELLLDDWKELRLWDSDGYSDFDVSNLLQSFKISDSDDYLIDFQSYLFCFHGHDDLSGKWIDFDVLCLLVSQLFADWNDEETVQLFISEVENFIFTVDSLETTRMKFCNEEFRNLIINELKFDMPEDATKPCSWDNMISLGRDVDALCLILRNDQLRNPFLKGGMCNLIHPGHVDTSNCGMFSFNPLGNHNRWFSFGTVNSYDIHLKVFNVEGVLQDYACHVVVLEKLWDEMIFLDGEDLPTPFDLTLTNGTQSLRVLYSHLDFALRNLIYKFKMAKIGTIEVSFWLIGPKTSISEMVNSVGAVFDLTPFEIYLDVCTKLKSLDNSKLLMQLDNTWMKRLFYSSFGTQYGNVYGRPSFKNASWDSGDCLCDGGEFGVAVLPNDDLTPPYDLVSVNYYSSKKSIASGHGRRFQFLSNLDYFSKLSITGETDLLKKECALALRMFDEIALEWNVMRIESRIHIKKDNFNQFHIEMFTDHILSYIVKNNIKFSSLVDNDVYASRHRAVLIEIAENLHDPKRISLMMRCLMFLFTGNNAKFPWGNLSGFHGGFPRCMPEFGNDLAFFKSNQTGLDRMSAIVVLKAIKDPYDRSCEILHSLLNYCCITKQGFVRISDMDRFTQAKLHSKPASMTFLNWIAMLRTFSSNRWEALQLYTDYQLRHYIQTAWNLDNIKFLPSLIPSGNIKKDNTQSLKFNVNKWYKINL